MTAHVASICRHPERSFLLTRRSLQSWNEAPQAADGCAYGRGKLRVCPRSGLPSHPEYSSQRCHAAAAFRSHQKGLDCGAPHAGAAGEHDGSERRGDGYVVRQGGWRRDLHLASEQFKSHQIGAASHRSPTLSGHQTPKTLIPKAPSGAGCGRLIRRAFSALSCSVSSIEPSKVSRPQRILSGNTYLSSQNAFQGECLK